MNDFDKGIFSLAEDLVITSGYSFEQFRDTKYYGNQNPERVFWLKDEFEFHDHVFAASLFFRNEIIYMLSLLCCDKTFSMEEEEKRKDYHDEILRLWAITQSEYPWGNVDSAYDPKSNISSIDIIFKGNE